MNRFLISSLTFTGLAALAAVASLCTGCADEVAEPYQLTHPRVLAIRTEPAAIPAEGEARLDVLFTEGETDGETEGEADGAADGSTDGAAAPRLATPDELTLQISPAAAAAATAAGLDLSALLSRQADGWRVRAPDSATLERARAALGLAAEAPVPLPLEVQLTTETASLLAQKVVPLGTFVGNPEPPQIRIADQLAASQTAVPTGSEISLRAELPTPTSDPAEPPLAGPPDDVSYRWFSSAGELRRYTQPAALLETSAADAGQPATLLVIARTAAGGTSWAFAQVLPTAPSEE